MLCSVCENLKLLIRYHLLIFISETILIHFRWHVLKFIGKQLRVRPLFGTDSEKFTPTLTRHPSWLSFPNRSILTKIASYNVEFIKACYNSFFGGTPINSNFERPHRFRTCLYIKTTEKLWVNVWSIYPTLYIQQDG